MDIIRRLWKKDKLLWGVLGSLFGAVGIWRIVSYSVDINGNLPLSTVVTATSFVLLLIAYTRYQKLERRESIFATIFALLLGGILVIGGQLEYVSGIFWSLTTIFYVLCSGSAMYPIIVFLLQWLKKLDLKNMGKINSRKLFWISFGVILAGGVLVWLALYPGIYGFDSSIQVAQQLEAEENLTAHYSMLLGWILGVFFRIGKAIFGSYQAGLAMAMLLQMITMTYIATRITMFTTKRTSNWCMYIFCLLFFSIFPFYTVMTVYAAQDVLFSGMLILVVLNLFEMVDDKTYWQKPFWGPIKLVVLATLMCMMRKNGVYALLVALACIALFYKERRWRAAGVVVVPIIISFIYSGPILTSMGILDKSSLREMMSVPSEQIARTYLTAGDSIFSGETLEDFNYYFSDVEMLEKYGDYPEIADFSKGAINNDVLREEPAGFLKLWAKVGMKASKTYIEAFLLNNLGLWYPYKQEFDERQYIVYLEYTMSTFPKDQGYDNLIIERDSKIPSYEEWLDYVVDKNGWMNFPVLSLLFALGTYFVTLIFTVGMVIVRKKWRILIPLGLLLGLAATVALAPVMSYRYGFALVLALPIMLSTILQLRKKMI